MTAIHQMTIRRGKMCEIFGVSSREKRDYTKLLGEFFSHSDVNPHGFGIASIKDGKPVIVKEPVRASESGLLEDVMKRFSSEDLLLAHIRLATKGQISMENTHPFTMEDDAGTSWTLVHNGTIFESSELSRYCYTQKGETDSERILCFLTDLINEAVSEGSLSDMDRIRIVEDMIFRITPENKVNILISDGRLLYAHTNFRESMYMMKREGDVVISSRPLTERDEWEELPIDTLLVFRQGEKIYEGSPHGNEFFETEEKMRFLFLDYAGM